MIKNLSGGSVIRYGAALPAPNITQDGTLFFKTSGTDKGLYVYNTVQDTMSRIPGDQTAQAWTPAVANGLQFDDDGAIINVNLRFTDPSLVIFCNNYAQVNRTGPMTTYSDSDFVWRKDFRGLNTEMMKLTPEGVLTVTGYTVWHAGNQMNADVGKLNGQPGSFYQNASNLNAGTVAIARLPFMPVQQGGGAGQNNSKIYIGYTNGNRLNLQVDSNNLGNLWPINVAGNADTATFATSASSAQNANFAQNAQEAVHAESASLVEWVNVNNRPTKVSQFVNDAGYITLSQVPPQFPAGTRMLFQQETPPVGWSRDSNPTVNNAALRIVTSGVGTGGVTGFSTAFSGSFSVGSTSLGPSQIPSHNHTLQVNDAGGASTYGFRLFEGGGLTSVTTGNTGFGAGHTHTLGMNLKYVDFVIGIKV